MAKQMPESEAYGPSKVNLVSIEAYAIAVYAIEAYAIEAYGPSKVNMVNIKTMMVL